MAGVHLAMARHWEQEWSQANLGLPWRKRKERPLLGLDAGESLFSGESGHTKNSKAVIVAASASRNSETVLQNLKMNSSTTKAVGVIRKVPVDDITGFA